MGRRNVNEKNDGIGEVREGASSTEPRTAAMVDRIDITFRDGVVIVFSDAHWLPGRPLSTANRALLQLVCQFATDGTLRAVIGNGDLFELSQASKHNRIMWSPQPRIADELEEVRVRMAEIAAVAGDVPLIFLVGNHDLRFSTRLAGVASQYERVPGFDLRDHIDPVWAMAWSAEVNGGETIIKHRLKSGAGASRANAIAASCNIITSHTHQPNVTRISTVRGLHFGCDTGTLSDLNSPAFTAYMENGMNLAGWASGFAVLTWADAHLLMPELVLTRHEASGTFEFRGKLHTVGVTRIVG
jgi:hypothetical protein